MNTKSITNEKIESNLNTIFFKSIENIILVNQEEQLNYIFLKNNNEPNQTNHFVNNSHYFECFSIVKYSKIKVKFILIL